MNFTKSLSFWSLMLIVSTAFALDSSDLLFDLSFDDGIAPDFARGSAEVNWGGDPLTVFKITDSGGVVKTATEALPRLVDGIIGKGYLFGGKASTLEYFTGDHGRRGCDEVYGLKQNIFGDTGSISMWIKPLTNSHNHTHLYFRMDAPGGVVQIGRNHYTSHIYSVRDGGNADLPLNGWIHFVMTWRKGELRLFASGYPCGTVNTIGLQPPTLPERFYIAATGLRTAEFCKKEFEDDVIIDELQIFRRALTPEEVRSLFERGHTTVEFPSGVSVQPILLKPQREFAPHLLAAPKISLPITVDGNLDDWNNIPAHGGFVEQRLGVLDSDPGNLRVAVDDTNLYLAYECEVDKSIQSDPTHVWYPAGEFKADAHDRDSNVLGDDYVEFVINDFRFAVNAKGALLDRRGNDAGWNSNAKCVGRSDFKNWTVEMAVPLADLGLKPGDIVDFNAIRSWKWFKSSHNTFCTDIHSGAGMGKLTLGAPVATVDSLGQPDKGQLAVAGSILGPAGKYTLKLRGKGFAEQTTVEVATGILQRFEIKKQLPKPDDMGVVVEALAPDGKPILVRTIPFVYVAASQVELVNYPGWGKLDVVVTPIPVEREGLKATVALMQGTNTVARQEIPKFGEPIQQVRFEMKSLTTGKYEVVTALLKGDQAVGEDRQPYEKKSLPPWYGSKVGIIDGPPIPWTDVKVRGQTIQLLIKEITFQKTLFPAQIVSNGQTLLSGPMRLRVKRGGVEKVITAGRFEWMEKTRRKASWRAVAKDGDLTITVNGWTEFDGFTWCDVTLQGGKVEHVSFEIPWRREAATLKHVLGQGVLGDKPLSAPFIGWIGNEKAGLQPGWEHEYHWVKTGEPCTITPSATEVVGSVPFIQKETTLDKPRTVNFYWAIGPTKPVRKDWRLFDRYIAHPWLGDTNLNFTTYGYVDWSMPTPNYPKPTAKTPEELAKLKNWLIESYERNRRQHEIVAWYAYGPFTWVGSPEYAEWWREWRDTTSALVPPDPNNSGWGPACYNSSFSDLFVSMLDKYVKEYPCRGLYFDCMPCSYCANEAHGCGFADELGRRLPVSQLLAMRRHFERIYNVIKAADPEYGWVRMHDWGPTLATAAFCDENWVGEGMIGPIHATPEQNYYHVVDLPMARVNFRAEHYGHLTAWLGELATGTGTDPKLRSEWFGREIEPGKDGKPGKWILPRWKDYEHECGLSFVNDTFSIGGNEMPLPARRLALLQRQFDWNIDVRFLGYWELADRLEVGNGVPEKIVCSIYYRPPGKKALGKPFLLLVPMNNTDADVILALKPNLQKLGFQSTKTARFADAYRAIELNHPMNVNVNVGATGPGIIHIDATNETFAMKDGAVTVPVEKRNFRALLLID